MVNRVLFDPHPKFNHRHFGLDYGETFHRDPIHRARELERVRLALFERFGRFDGVVAERGCLEEGVLPPVGIQPLDFLNAALGGRLVYQPDEAVWTPDKPLAHIAALEDVRALPELHWPDVPVFRDACEQYETLRRAFPGLRPGGFQNIEFQRGGDRATLVIHSPYTTAFRLMGDVLFEHMMLEPELAEAVFEYIGRQYRTMFEAACARFGWRPDGAHFGDCAATMLSPDLFERFNLPRYRRAAAEMGRIRLHSCGPSAHLIDLFARIPRIDGLQIGMGSDFPRLRRLFPETPVLAFLDPALIRNGRPDEVAGALLGIAEELGARCEIHLSSVDPDTRPDTLEAMLETAARLNRRARSNP